jgi:hypothetical protein
MSDKNNQIYQEMNTVGHKKVAVLKRKKNANYANKRKFAQIINSFD